MIPSGRSSYLNAFIGGLRPDEPLWVEEWTESYMMIPKESGAAEPGPYRLSRTPYAREIMHVLSPEHPARDVIIKGASQLLKTQVLLNWVCAMIDGAPANIIVLEPDDNLARRVAKRFDKSVAVIPKLQNKVARKQSRDDKNTATTKEFKGGTIWFLSGRSTAALAEATARYIGIDEVDRVLREQKGEGDTLTILRKRQSTFGNKAKTLEISSPTEEDASQIDEDFQKGDQRRFNVPCPYCMEKQVLVWENIRYERETKTARYECIACHQLIEEHFKTVMLLVGEWRSEAQGDGKTWSYEISFLYAPLGWDSWATLAQEYEIAEAELKKGQPDKMQVFYNTRLALVWSATQARIKPEDVQSKAESYSLGIAPSQSLVLTASVDVQGNRIELQIVSWGSGPSGLELWIVNTHIFFGDPTLPDVWSELDDLLTTPVRHAMGVELIISAVAIDSGDGDSTAEVYEFVRPRRRRYVKGHLQYIMAVKGASRANKPIFATTPGKSEYTYKGKAAKDAAEIWSVGTDTAKDWVMNRLVLTEQTVIHTSAELPLEFYQQLVSETKKKQRIRGKYRTFWDTIKKNQRNEQWDMLVYNLAMAHFLGLHRYTAKKWASLRAKLQQSDLIDAAEAEPSQQSDMQTSQLAPNPSPEVKLIPKRAAIIPKPPPVMPRRNNWITG